MISLALNVALLGVVVGGALRGMPHRHDVAGVQPDFRTLWRALPDHVRDNLRERGELRGGQGDERRERRRDRAVAMNRDIVRLLRADPFDADALETVLNRERLTLERRLQRMRHGFVEQLSAMSPAERVAMADELEETWRARGHFERDEAE